MSAAETKRSGTIKGLKITNTLTREKEDFQAIDDENVRLYVCGPTVYDYAHIGNARPVIVFDVLNRLLRHVYGPAHVTYVRNITDVDDKINARALRDHPDLPLNDAIALVTKRTTDQFHKDIQALSVLPPDHEPRATQHIDGMIEMIRRLIDKGHAYAAEGEVLFDTASMPDYGGLSKRKLDEQIAGARIAVDAHKKNPGDFVLWKLSSDKEPGWESPWGRGRPGWHIECSVMSAHHLGDVFDIHGGGLDLIFPHHENEIAQSCCANDTKKMANYWMHNGFLQVEGKKMSKSVGNFFTIQELLETENFGGRTWPGEVLRMAMLMTNYREPIDFSKRKLEEAENLLSKWPDLVETDAEAAPVVVDALLDDLNTAAAIQALHALAGEAARDPSKLETYSASAALLGLSPIQADLSSVDSNGVEDAVARRLAALKEKDWALADEIRADLSSQGIVLKDSKDSETGERITTWEVQR